VCSGYKPKTDFPKDSGLRFPTKRQKVQFLQEGRPFGTGKKYTMGEYQQYAEEFRQAYLREHALEREEGCSEQEHNARIEKEFWNIVETGSKDVTVDYANDLNSAKFGSGFDHDADCKWNMNTIHQEPRSLLREIQCEIQGVTKPWLYMGSLFTSFCWHTEDHYLYSLNYMHKGHPKTWYGIPNSSKEGFDLALKNFMPKRFKKNPDILYQLITLLSPSYCMEQGVHVNHAVQKEGEFIVTFPNAYHGGFSHGLNCAEAVNFALPEWMPFGTRAMEDYHKVTKKGGKRSDVFAHDQLLYHLGSKLSKVILKNKEKIGKPEDPKQLSTCIKAIVTDSLPFEAKPFVKTLLQDFSKSAKYELHYRQWLKSVNLKSKDNVSYSNAQPPQCWVCKNMPYFSHVQCKNHPERFACPQHAFAQCDCPCEDKGLAVVVSDYGIQSMQNFIGSIAKSM